MCVELSSPPDGGVVVQWREKNSEKMKGAGFAVELVIRRFRMRNDTIRRSRSSDASEDTRSGAR